MPMGGVGDALQPAKSAAEQIVSVKRATLLMSDVSRKLTVGCCKSVAYAGPELPGACDRIGRAQLVNVQLELG